MHNYNELDNSECNMNLGKRQVYVHNIQSIVFHPTCPPCLKKTSTSHSFSCGETYYCETSLLHISHRSVSRRFLLLRQPQTLRQSSPSSLGSPPGPSPPVQPHQFLRQPQWKRHWQSLGKVCSRTSLASFGPTSSLTPSATSPDD